LEHKQSTDYAGNADETNTIEFSKRNRFGCSSAPIIKVLVIRIFCGLQDGKKPRLYVKFWLTLDAQKRPNNRTGKDVQD